ncbi:class I SAM-dependent methyltransferase, partial [Candidatus Woesearchaeota archaeon]|nr:class I SAM-dependent methyltransferase [Candidatus Woesearchaeota archaeon]
MDDCIEHPDAIRYSIRKKLKVPILINSLKPQKHEKILDVACGGGHILEKISERCDFAVGIDLLYENAKEAGKKNKYMVVGDATALPFKDGVFDKILGSEIIEHISEDQRFVNELARTTKKEGDVILTTLTTNPTFSLIWLKKRLGINVESEFGHVRGGYANRELRARLENADLRYEQTTYYDYFFAELAWIITALGRIIRPTKKDWKSGEDQSTLDKSLMFKLYQRTFFLIHWFALLDKLIPKKVGHHI